jgi:hypothetical protein
VFKKRKNLIRSNPSSRSLEGPGKLALKQRLRDEGFERTYLKKPSHGQDEVYA